MKSSTKTILILIILAVLVVVFYMRNVHTVVEGPVPQPTPTGEPTFTWEYKEYEADFVTKNDVSIIATYPDGTKVTKAVETIEGSCNEYSSPDKDVYAKSKMIICYYAGFGRYFKVVKDDTGYAVMRKEFEEASPDHNPPVQAFKELVRF